MLIQLVRVLFGAQNVEVANPAWLSGGVQLLPNPVLPWNRIAVIAFVLLVLAMTAAAEQDPARHERARGDAKPRDGGLLRRAHRAGGHAGLRAGIRHRRARWGGAVAVGQRRAGAGARLHHRFVPVVVLGGVGQLAGTVAAAFGLGIVNKILEPQIGAVLGKILIPVLIVLFIQKRPQGLFALKGRVID